MSVVPHQYIVNIIMWVEIEPLTVQITIKLYNLYLTKYDTSTYSLVMLLASSISIFTASLIDTARLYF